LHFSTANLISTINDNLTINKLDAGMEKLEQTDFPLDSLLANVYDALNSRSSAKAIEFLLEMDDRLKGITVHGDQGRLV
jgi:signal transduction histidine kinase